MSKTLETNRLVLRPYAQADVEHVATDIFGDPSVAVMLAHDARRPENAHAFAEKWLSIMTMGDGRTINEAGGAGLYAMYFREDPTQFFGIGGTWMELVDGRWHGELFYASARRWHGRGLMGEAVDAIAERLWAIPNIGQIYGVYWDGINPASGKLLARAGLRPAERCAVLHEYSVEKCRLIHDFDIWRLAEAPLQTKAAVAAQSACRAGAFVAEGVLPKAGALSALEAAHGDALPAAALERFNWALAHPGMARLEKNPG
ncbi:MAG: GNAT family protein [Pseudomonadota bacterium]